MVKKVRLLLCVIAICTCWITASYGTVEDSANIFEGNVRINTLTFNNSVVKEPLLIWKGSYYLPMTPEIMNNLGIESAMLDDGCLAFTLGVPKISGNVQTLPYYEGSHEVDVFPYAKP